MKIAADVATATPSYPRAHYILGLALLQKEDYRDGIKKQEKALDLGRGANPKSYKVEEIWQDLARAKYLLWESESTQRLWEQPTLKESCLSALEKKHLRVFSTAAEADVPTQVSL